MNSPPDKGQNKTTRNSMYNSPRAREGVRLFSGLNAITEAFACAKDVVTVLFHGEPSSSEKPPAEQPVGREVDLTSHSYNTRSGGPEKRKRVGPGPAAWRSTMDDSDYVSVPRDFVAEQQRIYNRRQTLLYRLASICRTIAAYNSKAVRVAHQRRVWIHHGTLIDLEIMRPYGQAMPWSELWKVQRNHQNKRTELNRAENDLSRKGDDIRGNVMAWNTEAMRVNMALIEDPDLDESSFLEAMIMFKPFREETIVLVTQHTRFKVAQPGEYLDEYIGRVAEAQSQAQAQAQPQRRRKA